MAQDVALSRLKQGFESPMGHDTLQVYMAWSVFVLPSLIRKPRLIEASWVIIADAKARSLTNCKIPRNSLACLKDDISGVQ